jgi:type II secretory pathway pseudopilin PulG
MTDNDKPNGDGSAEQPPPYVPEKPETPDEPDTRRGSVSFQEAGTTTPRAPSLADQRAREVARRREREEAEAAFAEAARKRKRRKRILIGAGVTVGVVAVVAVIYASSTPDQVTAQCTSNGVIVDDDYCDDSYATSHGGYSSGGFVYIGGSSYRYNYGGSGSKGSTVSGGSYVAPSSRTPVATSSGKSVQRGGLGVGGSSSGGKSGGS